MMLLLRKVPNLPFLIISNFCYLPRSKLKSCEFQSGMRFHMLNFGKRIFILLVLPSVGIFSSCCNYLNFGWLFVTLGLILAPLEMYLLFSEYLSADFSCRCVWRRIGYNHSVIIIILTGCFSSDCVLSTLFLMTHTEQTCNLPGQCEQQSLLTYTKSQTLYEKSKILSSRANR